MVVRRKNRDRGRDGDSGFTLIEILIVVVILGILAAIVVPQFSNASTLARENTLKDDLRYLRTQIGVFKAQHEDTCPGYPNGDTSAEPTAEVFLQHMTGHTDAKCRVSDMRTDQYPFGPYLAQMPTNPITGKQGIYVYSADLSIPEPSLEAFPDAGWIYNPRTQTIIANTPGNDSTGVPYVDY